MTTERPTRSSGESRWILTVGLNDEQTFHEFYKRFKEIDEMLVKHGARRVELHGDVSLRNASHRHEYVCEGNYEKVTRELHEWPWLETVSWTLHSRSLEAIEEGIRQPEPNPENVPPTLTLDNKLDRIEELLVRVGMRLHRLEHRSRPERWEVQVNLEEYAGGGGSMFSMLDGKVREAIAIAEEFDVELSQTEDVIVELIFSTRIQAYAAVTALTRAGFKIFAVFPWHDDEIEMLEGRLSRHKEQMHHEHLATTEPKRTTKDTGSGALSPQQESGIVRSAAPDAGPGD